MSSPHRHTPPAPVRERVVCMCVHGSACTSFSPGHALHLIQTRLASATPSDWSDAVVEAADPASGDIVLRRLETETQVTLWSGSGAAKALAPGTPVALHERYHVLAVGQERFNILRG